jgi:hypothetical protein
MSMRKKLVWLFRLSFSFLLLFADTASLMIPKSNCELFRNKWKKEMQSLQKRWITSENVAFLFVCCLMVFKKLCGGVGAWFANVWRMGTWN